MLMKTLQSLSSRLVLLATVSLFLTLSFIACKKNNILSNDIVNNLSQKEKNLIVSWIIDEKDKNTREVKNRIDSILLKSDCKLPLISGHLKVKNLSFLPVVFASL